MPKQLIKCKQCLETFENFTQMYRKSKKEYCDRCINKKRSITTKKWLANKNKGIIIKDK